VQEGVLACGLQLQGALLGEQGGEGWRGLPGRGRLLLLPLVGEEEALVELLVQLVVAVVLLL